MSTVAGPQLLMAADAVPVITLERFRVMQQLIAGMRTTFDLSPSSVGQGRWYIVGRDGYVPIPNSGYSHEAMVRFIRDTDSYPCHILDLIEAGRYDEAEKLLLLT